MHIELLLCILCFYYLMTLCSLPMMLKKITSFFDALPINKTNLTRFFKIPLLHSPIISRSHKQ